MSFHIIWQSDNIKKNWCAQAHALTLTSRACQHLTLHLKENGIWVSEHKSAQLVCGGLIQTAGSEFFPKKALFPFSYELNKQPIKFQYKEFFIDIIRNIILSLCYKKD